MQATLPAGNTPNWDFPCVVRHFDLLYWSNARVAVITCILCVSPHQIGTVSRVRQPRSKSTRKVADVIAISTSLLLVMKRNA